MSVFQLIHKTLRCCLHCGSVPCGDSQFCLKCENDLWRAHYELQLFELGRKKISGWALFDWYPDQDRKVSKLMMTLKGGYLQDTCDYYAEAFIARYGSRLPKESIVVPCPSTPGRTHARVLSESFAKLLGVPFKDSLQKLNSENDQKSKDREARQRILIENNVDYSQHHVIFIDDIVTTGATALSAQTAIGPCRGFEVWCLAHRRQLAAYSSI